jgi:hypothetical protein
MSKLEEVITAIKFMKQNGIQSYSEDDDSFDDEDDGDEYFDNEEDY